MMKWFNILMARLRALFRRESVLQDIEEELRVHIEMETETNIERGMAPDEARAAALKSFGNHGRNTELGYDIRGGGWLETLWQDLRYGARALLRRPIFTLAIILTLALGIGANTAIFSVFNGIVLKPLPYKEPNRLVNVRRSDKRGVRYQPGTESSFGNISPGGFHDWRERSQSFESISAHRYNSTILGDANSTTRRAMYVGGLRVASRFFETYGVNAQLGRTFTDQDYSPDAPKVVILSHDLWRYHYGADSQIIGRTVLIDGLPHTVVGVMPPGFWLASWIPPIWIPYFFG